MKIQNLAQVEQKPVEMEGAKGCRVRQLLSANDGAPTFAMRQFEVAPQGHTPLHHHPYEHEVFVLEGSGVILEGNTSHRLGAGDVVLVSPDEVHQFKNTGDKAMKFLCLIPNSAANQSVTVVPECGSELPDP